MVDRTCQCCGGKFTARKADVARGWALFCSKRCKAREQERRTGQYEALVGSEHERIMDEVEWGWDAHKDNW